MEPCPLKSVSPGIYQVTEAVPKDWEPYLIVCDNAASSGDLGTATATFDVGPGEHVTCTFGNAHKDVPVLPATMIVAKETMPSGAPASFTFQGDAAGTIGDDQRIVVAGLEPGTYHSWELVPLGWRLYGIQCDDLDSTGDVAAATATFRLEAGETVTCTFTNLMQPYPLHLPLLLR